MQARIDAKLEAKAAAGPTAREGVGAGMSDAIPTLPLHCIFVCSFNSDRPTGV